MYYLKELSLSEEEKSFATDLEHITTTYRRDNENDLYTTWFSSGNIIIETRLERVYAIIGFTKKKVFLIELEEQEELLHLSIEEFMQKIDENKYTKLLEEKCL